MRISTKLSLAFSSLVFIIVSICVLFLVSILRSSAGIDTLEEEIGERMLISDIDAEVDAIVRSAVERIEQKGSPYDDTVKHRLAALRIALRKIKSDAATTGEPSPDAVEHNLEEDRQIDLLDGRLANLERVLAGLQTLAADHERSAAVVTLHHRAEDIDDAIRGFYSQDRKEFVRAFRTARRTQGQSIKISIYGAAAAIVLAVILGALFYRMIAGPLRNLQEEVKSIAAGDFSRRLPVKGGNEFGALAKSVNEMAEDLQSLYSTLEQRVQERTQQLARAEKLATVGKMAAGLAHEINNPLGPVAACAESLYERARSSAGSEETQQYLRAIIDGVYRCKSVTEGLLNFSRQGPAKTEPVDLMRIVDGTLALLEYQAKAKNARMTAELRGDRPVVSADPSQMQQLLFNLVSNGLDAVPGGGCVVVTVKDAPLSAEIEVADDGCGIPPDLLPRIFEPFFTTKPPGKGTGLGLAVCYSIVERHGGTITLHSEGAGKGSRFIVALPKKREGA